MKRFTETGKWEDPWFRKLKPELKLIWLWLLDSCDNAGVIDLDIELASFQIGYRYPMDTLSKLTGRVVKLPGGKYFIPKFIEFQYTKLSPDCKAHNPIFASLEKHGLKGYPYPMDTLQEKETETVKETEEEKDHAKKSKSKGTLDEVIQYTLEVGGNADDGEHLFNKWEGNGWTNNGDKIKDWRATVRSWKAAGYLPSQKQKPYNGRVTADQNEFVM